MKWKKIILSFLSFLFITFPLFSQNESITITTYYPSPYGVYNNLQANKFSVGDTDGDGVLTSSDLPNKAGDIRLKPQIGSPSTWSAGKKGEIAYSDADKTLYFYTGTAWSSSSGGGSHLQVFTSSGTFTVPSGVTQVKVTLVGGGGGGGGGYWDSGDFSSSRGGGGGGGGAWVMSVVNVTPGQVIQVTVGSGGTGGIGGHNGTSGGNTSFGNLAVAYGGQGGRSSHWGTGGNGGGGNGLVVIQGESGERGVMNGADYTGGQGGAGGNSGNGWGIGGAGGGTSGAPLGGSGGNGSVYGGGGGGGECHNHNGGNGAPGLAIVEW